MGDRDVDRDELARALAECDEADRAVDATTNEIDRQTAIADLRVCRARHASLIDRAARAYLAAPTQQQQPALDAGREALWLEYYRLIEAQYFNLGPEDHEEYMRLRAALGLDDNNRLAAGAGAGTKGGRDGE